MPWRGVTVSEQTTAFPQRLPTELLFGHRAGGSVQCLPQDSPQVNQPLQGAGGTAQAAPSLGSTQVAQPDAAPGSQAGASGCVTSSLILRP